MGFDRGHRLAIHLNLVQGHRVATDRLGDHRADCKQPRCEATDGCAAARERTKTRTRRMLHGQSNERRGSEAGLSVGTVRTH